MVTGEHGGRFPLKHPTAGQNHTAKVMLLINYTPLTNNKLKVGKASVG